MSLSKTTSKYETQAQPDPNREIALRIIAMPADANPGGSIFGGWLLSQMDLAGATIAVKRTLGPVATIAVNDMVFLRPVLVGDEVTVYADIIKTGKTSITVKVESWVGTRFRTKVMDSEEDYNMMKVTDGIFTYVAIDPVTRKRRDVPEISE